MERDVFQLVQQALRPLRRNKPRGQRYADADIVLVAFWAALHDRPIDWACRRSSWPPARRPRALPHQSRLSRRLRSPSVRWLICLVQLGLLRGLGACAVAVLDGRAMVVSRYTTDRDAKRGWAHGGFARGYKVHALIDARTGRTLLTLVTPLNVAECVAARVLLSQAKGCGLLAKHALILADANYDSNPLHRHAARLGLRLLAPRRKPGTGLGFSAVGGHHANRLVSIAATETDPTLASKIAAVRGGIERAFSRQVCTGGGLRELPAWVRTLPRVRLWVALKIMVHLVRDHLSQTAAA